MMSPSLRSFAILSLWMVPSVIILLSFFGCGTGTDREDSEGVRTVRWGTSAVGSSGHRAMVNLAAMLNREMESLRITVLPMPGAIMTLRGYQAGDLDAYYGSDIAFYEMAVGSGRFAGTDPAQGRELVQSFWAYSMDMGLAIRAQDRDQIQNWKDLEGRAVFTGPGPWDTRAHLERLLAALGIQHQYVEIDLGMAGSQLGSGVMDAIGIYTTGGRDVAPWVAEAELSTDLAVLNPNPKERKELEEAGFELISAPPDVLRGNVYVEEMLLSPFYYGFHPGLDFTEEEVYQMLLQIEKNASELVAADPVFGQIATSLPEVQRRGVSRAVNDVRVHPGLARYMRERSVWDEQWDDRIALSE